MLSIRVLTDVDELAPLRASWNALAGDVPFRRWEWANAWWRHYGAAARTNSIGDGAADPVAGQSPEKVAGRRELYLLEAREGDRLVGIAPWHCEQHPVRGRVLQFLGVGPACSEYLDLLTESGREDDFAAAIVQWLLGPGRDDWHALELADVDVHRPSLAALVRAFPRRRIEAQASPGINTWVISLAPNWDAWLASVSRNRRIKIRQIARKSLDAPRAKWHQVRTREELRRGFDILVELHQKRWNALGEPGCFASRAFLEMQRDICDEFFALGILRLGWLDLDGRPAAVEYQFRGGARMYRYVTGFDPDFKLDQAGSAGLTAAVRSAIEEGCDSYDFLRGDEEYKLHWHASPVPTTTVTFTAPGWNASGRAALWGAYQAGRRAVRNRWHALRDRFQRKTKPAPAGREPAPPAEPPEGSEPLATPEFQTTPRSK